MRKKELIIFILMSLFLFNCSAIKLSEVFSIEGTYESDSQLYEIQIHQNNKFVLLKKNVAAYVIDCDTISYGSWSMKNNQFITLNSDNSFNSNIMFIKSIEQTQRGSIDSIYIEIKNPIEDNYPHQEILKYDYFLNYEGEADIHKLMMNKDNTLVFSKPFSKFKLLSANLEIHYTKPTNLVSGEYLGLISLIIDEFNFPQEKGNYYIINLSDLTRCYLEYARFNETVIEIKEDMIFWKGEKFKKIK